MKSCQSRSGSACLDGFGQFISGAWRVEPTRRGAVQTGSPSTRDRRASVKRAMRPDLFVEGHVARHPLMGVANGLVGVEIDLFIFETPPQPFQEHVVAPAAGPVHADLDAVVFQESGELLTGELAPLIGIEDSRGP
jgi:hypothetical protein